MRVKTTQAEREAAEWIVRLTSPDATDADIRAFEAWIKRSTDNEHAYRTRQQYMDVLPSLKNLDDYDALVSEPFYESWALAAADWVDKARAVITRPQFTAALASAALFLIAGVIFVTIAAPKPDYATEIAEIRALTLDDGSVVTLGAKSSVDVTFSDTERRVMLLAGEAFFEVEKDPARPFFVEANDTIVRVVGTKFDVRRGAGNVRVSVLEGLVEVNTISRTNRMPASVQEASTQHMLTAGQRLVSVAKGDLTSLEVVQTEDVAPWRNGRLVYVEARLSDVVSDLNRYYDGEIRLGDEAVGELEFTAALRTNQIENLIFNMSYSLPVEVVRDRENRIILKSLEGEA